MRRDEANELPEFREDDGLRVRPERLSARSIRCRPSLRLLYHSVRGGGGVPEEA